jgi:large subunit ribosomal protein L29
MPLKLAEMKEMSVEDLQEELKKSRLELATLRMKFASRQLDNPSLIKKTRKEVARILTIQTQKLKEKPLDISSEQEGEKIAKSKKLKKQQEKLERLDKEEGRQVSKEIKGTKKRTKKEK